MTQPTGPYPFPASRCPFHLADEFAWLRVNAPVTQITLRDGNTGWLVTRNQDIRTVLTDERFSRMPGRAEAVRQQRSSSGDSFDFGMSITDPADHARWRALATKVLNVRHAESLRPTVAAIVDDLLNQIADTPAPVDIMNTLAFPLPLRVLLELFDVPPALHDGFQQWANQMRGLGSSIHRLHTAMGTLHRTITELVSHRPGGLLRAFLDSDPDLTDQQLAASAMLLTIAGHETIATQLGNALHALLLHPDQLCQLTNGQVDITAAVEEILRFAQAGTGFAGTTHTTEDVELAGTIIPAGATVFISIDSANRDETHLTRPDMFELSRGAASSHLTFGFGHHFCLGAPLARIQLQESLRRLLTKFPGLTCARDPRDLPQAANMFTHYPAELPITW